MAPKHSSIKQINRRFILAMQMIVAEKDGKIKYFCEQTGISPASISMIKSNTNNVTVEQIAKVCQLFDISAEWIILGRGNMYC